MKTKLTEMLGIKHPIIQAPMGPFYTTKLAAAVTNAGGFGIISHTNLFGKDPIKEMEDNVKWVKENSEGPFGVNIRVARLQIDAPELQKLVIRLRKEDPELRERLKVVITSAGNPKPPATGFKQNDPELIHFHVAPTLYHAMKVDGLCDGIICTGYEGGGHQSYEGVNTSVLIAEAVENCKKPVVACGGLFNGRGLAGALAMGAVGIQMGTRFIATKECDFHENYKNFVVSSKDADTVVTQGMLGPIRLLKNEYTEDYHEMLTKDQKKDLEQSIDLEKLLEDQKKYELVYQGEVVKGPILCGESCGGINDIPTVKEVIERTVKEAEKILKGIGDLIA
ncbi:MAG: NAD(P)H-dependent flavin oxidoreductase [Candidatus Lokiarchaeia archaeon]